ncbi:hypothetical protein BJ742DRAFT_817207 [Cladochytrium replicatum]|nr:hypothetical protein BJ742DRAFT_817207 [Cladochytrium replicatum]
MADQVISNLVSVSIAAASVVFVTSVLIFAARRYLPTTHRAQDGLTMFQKLTIGTLSIILVGTLSRIGEFLFVCFLLPAELEASPILQRLVTDQGWIPLIDGVWDIISQIINQFAALCFFGVLLDRYKTFGFFLPFGTHRRFRLSLAGVGFSFFIIYYVHFVLVNFFEEPFDTMERSLIVITRSLPIAYVTVLDLTVSVLLCRAAFKTAQLLHFANVSTPGIKGAGLQPSSPSRSPQKGAPSSQPSNSFVDQNFSDLAARKMLVSRSLGDRTLEATTSGVSDVTVIEQKQLPKVMISYNVYPPSSYSPPPPRGPAEPRPSDAATLASPVRQNAQYRGISVRAIFSDPLQRRSFLLFMSILLTDLMAVFIYIAPMNVPAIARHSRAVELVASCSLAIHWACALLLFDSLREIMNGQCDGHERIQGYSL